MRVCIAADGPLGSAVKLKWTNVRLIIHDGMRMCSLWLQDSIIIAGYRIDFAKRLDLFSLLLSRIEYVSTCMNN